MFDNDIKSRILYEDGEVLVYHKPAGIAVQNARIGAMDLESALKNYLSQKSQGKIPYLAVVHRLDQPVEGVLVFGLTPKAAASLSNQISNKTATKKYLAVTDREPAEKSGILEDYLKKESKGNISKVAQAGTKGAKKSRLSYKVLKEVEDNRTETGKRILMEIQLETGRHHQIRVQMSNAGMPLLGDRKYNMSDHSRLPLGLCSCQLVFSHPKTGKKMDFSVIPENMAFAGF